MIEATPEVLTHGRELLAAILDNPMAVTYDPAFRRRCERLGDEAGFRNFMRNITYLFELAGADVSGATVFDAGCGSGLTSLMMKALGAKEVYGIDLGAKAIETFSSYVAYLGLSETIHPCRGDVSALPYPSESFDFVYCNEAVSHFLNVPAFLAEAHRVLKLQGRLLLSDGNNGCNLLVQRRTHEVWEAFENGPARTSLHGHTVELPYVLMRRALISKQFPNLTDSDLDLLSRGTSGMTKEEILDICRDYVNGRTIPQRTYMRGTCPIHPEGMYIERLFNPLSLAKEMRAVGFDTRVYAHFGGAGSHNLMALVNSLLRAATPLTIYVARGFKIVATKMAI